MVTYSQIVSDKQSDNACSGQKYANKVLEHFDRLSELIRYICFFPLKRDGICFQKHYRFNIDIDSAWIPILTLRCGLQQKNIHMD